MIKPRHRLALLIASSLLVGCGRVVVFGHTIGEPHPAAVAIEAAPTPPPAIAVNRAAPTASTVKSVNVVMTQQAVTQAANDPRFQADALLEAITTELRSRGLIADSDPTVQGTAEISIDDFSLHATSNVVLFGRIISAGSLRGDVRVRDAIGSDVQSFRVEAASQVSVAASGETANPLEPLYRRFAVLAGDRLAGIQSRSAPGADQHYRSGS